MVHVTWTTSGNGDVVDTSNANGDLTQGISIKNPFLGDAKELDTQQQQALLNALTLEINQNSIQEAESENSANLQKQAPIDFHTTPNRKNFSNP